MRKIITAFAALTLLALTGCATQYMPNWDNKRSGHFDKECSGGVVCKSYVIEKNASGAISDAR